MSYGLPPGAAAAAAATSTAAQAASAAASPAQVQKAQQQAFSIASNFSQQVGPPTRLALSELNKALPEIRAGVALAKDAEEKLIEALDDLSGQLSAQKWYVRAVDNDMIPIAERAVRQARQGVQLLRGYRGSVESVLQNVTNIQTLLRRKEFVFNSGSTHFKHKVDSCRDLRMFSGQLRNVSPHLRGISSEMGQIRQTLDYYGNRQGKQTRNQTQQLLINLKLTVNDMMAAMTDFMRSGVKVSAVRAYIDLQNGSNCGKTGGTKYIGPIPRPQPGQPGYGDRNNYAPMTVEDHANTCHGLNQFGPIMRLVAKKQGRTWTAYRQRWNRLSNSDKKRNIVTGFDEARKVLKGLRDRKIPNARAAFIKLFSGMSDAIGRSGPGVGLSQARIDQFGPFPTAYLEFNAARSQVIRAQMDASKYEPVVTPFVNPANVQCQHGSGYAGIFGGDDDDGEPMNPMLVVGGGLVAGLAVAHFLPNLLRR